MENNYNSTRIIDGGLWLIRLRWIAIVGIIVATKFSSDILHITIREIPLYALAVVLFIFNLISFFGIKYIIRKEVSYRLINGKSILYFQIYSDLLILTCLLHFSGGVENPFIIYYIFHMIISSILLSPLECYIITSFILSFIGALAFLEYQGIIPHYNLEGFYTHSFYQNKIYLMGTGGIFITTSYMVVYMTTSISSKLRKQEEAYRKANIELENKDTIKNEYVLRLTHDIKGHIAAIQNILQAALVTKKEEEKRDFVNQAYKRTRGLMNFVRDLLKLTSLRLQNKLEMHEFSIEESLKKVIQEVKAGYPDKQISINANIADTAVYLYGNQLSIEEALNNLLSNAIKYSPEGSSVDVKANKFKGSCIIEIIDRGIGIPKNEQKLIFNEFYRASNVSKIEKTSSGFGLSLVKQIIDKHQGKISVDSELNTGTKIILKIPLYQSDKKKTFTKWFLKNTNQHKKRSLKTMERKKLLIIDDDPDILKSLKVILEDKDFIVYTASNKAEGLKLCSSERPDLIILDIMMDYDLEGYGMLNDFRNDKELSNIPIIMYSGMAQQIGVNFRSAVEDDKMFPDVSFVDKREDVQDLILKIKEVLKI